MGGKGDDGDDNESRWLHLCMRRGKCLLDSGWKRGGGEE